MTQEPYSTQPFNPQDNFSALLRNPHFCQFVALISVPFNSIWWRQHHQKVPFWTRIKTIQKLMHDGGLAHSELRKQFIMEFTTLIREIVEADPKLFYRIEDMDWFVKALDSDYATLTFSMLLAQASSRTAYVTPAQIAEATETSESHWRNKAAAHEIIGTFKAGKQWLIPVTSLRAYGVSIEIRGQELEDEQHEES